MGSQLHGYPQGIYEQSATQQAPLGARLVHEDGNGSSLRVFRYAKNGAAALAAGKLCQSAANGGGTTVQKELVVVSHAAVGSNLITLTAATDSHTADKFKDGFLSVYDGSAAQGVGQTYTIKSNTAAGAGADFTVTLYDKFIVSVLAGTATANVVKHPYDAIVICNSTITGIPVGDPLIAVTISYYCWVQTYGPCCVLGDGTWAYATGLAASNATSGALEVSDGALPDVGYAMIDSATTKYGCAFLQIAP